MPPKTPERSQINRPSTAVVTRQFFRGKDPATERETKNEQLEVRTFVTEPAKVSVGEGLTLNLGNFESARIDISVVLPCYQEEIDDAYTYAQRWVEERLAAEVDDIRKNKPSLF